MARQMERARVNRTISDEYRAEQQQLHRNKRYGIASLKFASLVRTLLDAGKCRSLSDYGAGKCRLGEALGLRDGGRVAYYPYDPAFPAYGGPCPADLVTCIDVLEHIEPAMLPTVLDQLANLTEKLALLTVHTGPSTRILTDGRNAHLIQEGPGWWIPQLVERFDFLCFEALPKGFFVIAARKGSYAELAAELDLGRIAEATARTQREHRRKGLRAHFKAFRKSLRAG
jgi:hypothetical protein